MDSNNNYPVYSRLSPMKISQLIGDDFDWEIDDDCGEEDFDLENQEHNFDCGFIQGEGCSMAGTEDCDFDCPYRDNLMKHPAYPNCDLHALDYSN